MKNIYLIALFTFFLFSCGINMEKSHFAKRVDFRARLEPKGQILSGAGQSPEAFAHYVDVVGRQNAPSIFMFYIGLHEDPVKWMKEQKKEMEKYEWMLIPQIGVSMTRDHGNGYDKDVANGMYDLNIHRMIDLLKEWNMPVFLRIGYEFSGSWNGYEATSYKQAFIRITKKIREAGLDNVATVWCYGLDDHNPVDFMSYYPGDEFVDWWGIDLFRPEEFSNKETISFIEKSLIHSKPLMIGESTPRNVGVLNGKDSWNSWFKLYFEILNKYPHFKAFCYINWDWSRFPQWHDWGDGRLERNKEVSGLFNKTLRDPIFRHGSSRRN